MLNKEFQKPLLSTTEQINLLIQRGLIIHDKEIASIHLSNITYYHLSIYCKAFQNQENNLFLNNTSFEDILNLYLFDKKLRLKLLDLLERIEMSLKHSLSHIISHKTRGVFWYINKNNFNLKIVLMKKSIHHL